jgi:hypothetical protein
MSHRRVEEITATFALWPGEGDLDASMSAAPCKMQRHDWLGQAFCGLQISVSSDRAQAKLEFIYVSFLIGEIEILKPPHDTKYQLSVHLFKRLMARFMI